MALQIELKEERGMVNQISDEQIIVTPISDIVSKPDARHIVGKVVQILAYQGTQCFFIIVKNVSFLRNMERKARQSMLKSTV